MFKGVNVCVYVGEGLRHSVATPDPFVLINKICLNQTMQIQVLNSRSVRSDNIPVLLSLFFPLQVPVWHLWHTQKVCLSSPGLPSGPLRSSS